MAREAQSIAENAARTSYGRLLSILAARSHDIAAAEEALSEAFVSALTDWPKNGVPNNPDAWLLTVARNQMNNEYRHQKVVDAAAADLLILSDQFAAEDAPFPDDRLKLLFVCAHPAIDSAFRTPLMLQTVLGLNAVQIGAAFLVAPTTMGQRLTRVKSKIKEVRLRFELPSPEEMPERLDDVLSAIYTAYGTSWEGVAGAMEGWHDLAEEALYLCRLIISQLPDQPEPRGLLSLMLFCESRRQARRNSDGQFVPLKMQDVSLWSRPMIIEADEHLILAARSKRFGRFQCEAAIQSVHAQTAITGVTQHAALETLYELLARHCPSVGVLVAQAAAALESGNTEKTRQTLDRLDPEDVKNYQPYWVTLAAFQRATNQPGLAATSLQTAIGLTEDTTVRDFLREIGQSTKSP